MKNWRTTLAGLLVGGGYAVLTALSKGMTFRDALISGGIVLMGFLQKDFNVTGTGA